MNYNDFPILSNEEYNLMNEHFNNNHQTDRKTQLFKILTILNNCFNICIGLTSLYNLKINNAINNTKKCIEKNINNINSTFNIEITNTKTILRKERNV